MRGSFAALERLHLARAEPPADAAGDFENLRRQVERAQRWYREEFGIIVVSSEADPQPFSYLHYTSPNDEFDTSNANPDDETHRLLSNDRYLNENGYHKDACPGKLREIPTLAEMPNTRENWIRYAREDEEFRHFSESVQENDALMDAALDRIESSLLRLRDSTEGISLELNTQNELLDDTEMKLNQNENELRSINRRLQRSLAELESSTVCSYVFCLLSLLFVLSLLIRVVSQ
ncbi:unnamed protein product, partial [Phytomonas sp. Hart1]